MNLILIAFIAEALAGYPQSIYRKIKHPVVWMGAVISCLEKNCNRGDKNFTWRKGIGALSILLLLAITLLVSLLITAYTHPLVQILCMASLFSTRSLYDHVYAVFEALSEKDIEEARVQLAKIVGRDVEHLDESEIAKAAIESLAESFCDGVVAPMLFAAFFGAFGFGLAGIACYKAISTADSMIGHKTERLRAFGWAAARLDDVFNYLPARISALLIAIASYPFTKRSLLCTWQDCRQHASPNSGFPEAAMAGALGVCLGGERSYDGEVLNAPLIGEIFPHQPTSKNLQQALHIYLKSCALLWLILLIAAIVL